MGTLRAPIEAVPPATPTYGPEDIRPWTRLDPPVWWQAIGDYVIGDRYLPDGTRQHMVRGHVETGRVVCNAQIIGEDDVIGAEGESVCSIDVTCQRSIDEARGRLGAGGGVGPAVHRRLLYMIATGELEHEHQLPDEYRALLGPLVRKK